MRALKQRSLRMHNAEPRLVTPLSFPAKTLRRRRPWRGTCMRRSRLYRALAIASAAESCTWQRPRKSRLNDPSSPLRLRLIRVAVSPSCASCIRDEVHVRCVWPFRATCRRERDIRDAAHPRTSNVRLVWLSVAKAFEAVGETEDGKEREDYTTATAR